jgi:ketosteroid isomerase-like protein
MAGKKAAIEKLVQDVYAARKRGDYDAMAEMCAANASLQLAGAAEHCPIAGTTCGRARLREQFAALGQFAFANQKMLSLTTDGDRAAVHWRARVTYKPTGKSAVMEFCDLCTVKNGKVQSAVQFIDTALVAEMMR